MNTFSFRAEYQVDVNCFLQKSLDHNIKVTVTKTVKDKDGFGFPVVDIEFQSEAKLEDLNKIMREVRDGHVMYHTLRQVPLEQNSLHRNYNL